MRIWQRLLAMLLTSAMLCVLSSCAELEQRIQQVQQNPAELLEMFKDLDQKRAALFQEFTPEQEYYIGRAVAATVLHEYPPYFKPRLTRYVNLIGQTLALASDRPATFTGYHFLVLDSDEINAFAAPSGFIFVSRGLLRLCKSEDEVAAVLAHEIGHVQARHGINAIKKSRVAAMAAAIAADLSKKEIEKLPGLQFSELTKAFEGSVKDVTSTIINKGYSRRYETAADRAAVELIKRVGYNPHAIVRILTAMQRRVQPEQKRFARSHPDPGNRIDNIRQIIGS